MADAKGDTAATAVDFVSAYAAVAAEVVATIPSCDMDLRVPACPGWTAYDLISHLGNVHAWAATIVETGRSAPEQNDHPRSRRAKVVARWYAAKAEDLLQVLRVARPEDECWTFSAAHHTEAFWPRRQAHETLVHLVDLLQSAGRTAAIPSSLAADGVSEVLEVFIPRMHARGRPATIAHPVVLRATDTGDTWLVTPPLDDGEGTPLAGTVAWDTVADVGLDTVSGTAADLMLLLWKRLTLDDTRDHVTPDDPADPSAAGPSSGVTPDDPGDPSAADPSSGVSPDDPADPSAADPYPAVTLDGDRTRLLAFLRSPLTP